MRQTSVTEKLKILGMRPLKGRLWKTCC